MTVTLRKAVAGLAAAGSLTLAAAAPALAATGPVNPPTVTGTFVCNDTASGKYVASGTYVINVGNSKAAQTWEAAHLTFTSGLTGTGVFIQTASALGTPPEFKGSATPADPGPLQCLIQSPPGTPIGTVWGRIVTTG
jgi:hypothetical protein